MSNLLIIVIVYKHRLVTFGGIMLVYPVKQSSGGRFKTCRGWPLIITTEKNLGWDLTSNTSGSYDRKDWSDDLSFVHDWILRSVKSVFSVFTPPRRSFTRGRSLETSTTQSTTQSSTSITSARSG
ncbi:hypothetical protein PoB_006324400 [Plakobranchus ocellatus]|uniref:Uncharacterized protein n=1 Tax=Plakobranchus ocellatus TaxID=259542 RepID=A0AAV4CXV9_9GAST|nr:hypothetical protein PoB_006324400 [Plakobranchus ocellatus]